jgi:hypothetical protein
MTLRLPYCLQGVIPLLFLLLLKIRGTSHIFLTSPHRRVVQGKGAKIREASLLSRVVLSYPEHPSKGEGRRVLVRV